MAADCRARLGCAGGEDGGGCVGTSTGTQGMVEVGDDMWGWHCT